MAIRGKTGGAGCIGDKEIKTPCLLLCKSYVEFNNLGKNNQACTTIFIPLMQKSTMQMVTLFMSVFPSSGVTPLSPLIKPFPLFPPTQVNAHFIYSTYHDLKQDFPPNIFTASSLSQTSLFSFSEEKRIFFDKYLLYRYIMQNTAILFVCYLIQI